MLKRFGFRGKMYYLCPSEEEKALNTGVFSSFFAEKGQKNHCFTKHLGNFICRRKISTCFCGFFSGQVGARIDDVATRKVKRYLFSNLHFFSFRGTTQVGCLPENMGLAEVHYLWGVAVCALRWGIHVRMLYGRS